MEETLTREEYDNILAKIMQVKDIFVEYYGEDRVDLKGIVSYEDCVHNERPVLPNGYAYLIIWFPEETVTNEHDQSVKVFDIYVKVPVMKDGKLRSLFNLKRTTFQKEQWLRGYLHSHVPTIGHGSVYGWSTPCLGKSPINATVDNLMTECNFDLWGLLCVEIEDFIQTESIAGVPYVRMESITTENLSKLTMEPPNYNVCGVLPTHMNAMMLDFIRGELRGGLMDKVPFSYECGRYIIAMPYTDWVLYLTDRFIKWYNREDNPYNTDVSTTMSDLVEEGILVPAIMTEEGLMIRGDEENENSLDELPTSPILVFKGENKYFHLITDIHEEDRNGFYILNPDTYIKDLRYNIDKIINLYYGKISLKYPNIFRKRVFCL